VGGAPLTLMVTGHAALLAAVDLHLGGVRVDRDRGRRPDAPDRDAGSSASIWSVAASQPDSTVYQRADRVANVHTMAVRLGLLRLLGPACPRWAPGRDGLCPLSPAW
jgi:hypothetical protein